MQPIKFYEDVLGLNGIQLEIDDAIEGGEWSEDAIKDNVEWLDDQHGGVVLGTSLNKFEPIEPSPNVSAVHPLQVMHNLHDAGKSKSFSIYVKDQKLVNTLLKSHLLFEEDDDHGAVNKTKIYVVPQSQQGLSVFLGCLLNSIL